MYSKFKLTLTAITVSLALAACKSTEGSHIVNKNERPQAVEIAPSGTNMGQDNNDKKENPSPEEIEKPIDIEQPKEPDKPTETEQPKEPEKPIETEQPEKPNKPEPTKPLNNSNVKLVKEDSSGKLWRIVPLTEDGFYANASNQRRLDSDYFSTVEESVFSGEEFSYNSNIIFNLDKNDQSNSDLVSLASNSDYLGVHSGTYQDKKLTGTDTVNYLYVNQPYSSYGALFSDAADSNLFHIRLATGRSEDKQLKKTYAEYAVFDIVDGKAQWNSNLIGDATYNGKVIARIEEKVNGDTIISEPKVDGDVTMVLHLNKDWDKNSLKGYIDSHTLGKIELQNAELPEKNARLSSTFISFNGEASVESAPHLEGNYYTQFAGENLNDVVGKIELEDIDDIESGVTKYNAVFGGVKQ